MDYNKFQYLLLEEDKTREELAEMFNITVEDADTLASKLYLLETCKLDGRFGHRHDPLDAREVKSLFEGLVEKKLMTLKELASHLGVTTRHIRRLCNSVESSKFVLPKKIPVDDSPEAIARAKSV